MPFDEDPADNRCELDLCVDEIHRLQADLTTKESQSKQLEEIIDRLTAENAEMKKEMATLYREAYKHGLTAYAWWKDGVQYVGSCGTTLKDAMKEIPDA